MILHRLFLNVLYNGEICPSVSVREIQQVSLWGLSKEYFTSRYKLGWEILNVKVFIPVYFSRVVFFCPCRFHFSIYFLNYLT